MKPKRRRKRSLALRLQKPTPYVPPIDAESPDFYRGTTIVSYRLSAAQIKKTLGLPDQWTLMDGYGIDKHGNGARDIYESHLNADPIEYVEVMLRVTVPGPIRAMEILSGDHKKNV